MKKYASYACILAAAACWGCIGLFNRPLLNAGIAPENLVVIRNLGGLAVLALFFLCTDRSVFKMKAKHLPIFIATGIISVVLFTLCYFNAQKLCSLSVSAILLYTAPAMVVLMSALVFKEKITGKKLLALALALLGCALVTGVFTGGLSLTTKGLLFGLGAAFFYALYSIFAPFGLRHYSPLAVVFWTFVFAALGALFVADWGNLMTVLNDGSERAAKRPPRCGTCAALHRRALHPLHQGPCQRRERQGQHHGEHRAGRRHARRHPRFRRAHQRGRILGPRLHFGLRVYSAVILSPFST